MDESGDVMVLEGIVNRRRAWMTGGVYVPECSWDFEQKCGSHELIKAAGKLGVILPNPTGCELLRRRT